MLKYAVLSILAVLMVPSMASAEEPPACVVRYAEGARLIGKGSYYFLLQKVYDAALYAPRRGYNQDKVFALSLTYHMKLKGKKISEKSIEEMKRIDGYDASKLDQWQEQMNKIFPDVEEGVTLTGVHRADGKTIFCNNDKKIGVINDAAFGRYFFGIWLDKKTEDSVLRSKLLNLAP